MNFKLIFFFNGDSVFTKDHGSSQAQLFVSMVIFGSYLISVICLAFISFGFWDICQN